MTRPPHARLGAAALLAAALVLSGCTGFRKQPQTLFQPPVGGREKWPMTAPPGDPSARQMPANPAAGLQQAGFTQPGAGPLASNVPAPSGLAVPVLPKLQTPEAIAAADGFARVRELCDLAQKRTDDLSCYFVRMRKREVVNGAKLPEDVVLFKYRDKPFSVYIKALEESPTAGREVVFVNGRHNDMLQIRTGKGDILSGMRMELSPTAPRATANSRRTVLESGFPNIVARFANAVKAEQAEQTGRLTPMGLQRRPEHPTPMQCVRQVVPPGKEKHLPGGGERFWYFAMDPASPDYGLPMVITTLDEMKREVEYYAHDRLVLNVALSDEDFDPERLWTASR